MQEQAPQIAPVVPVATSADIARLRWLTAAALFLALSAEFIARLLKNAGFQPFWISEALSLIAVVLICGTGVYLVWRLPNRPALKVLIVAASLLVLFSETLNISEDIAFFNEWPLFGRGMPGQSLSKSLSLVLGLMLTLLVAFMAMLEAVGAELELAREKQELKTEVEVRKATESALERSREELRGLTMHAEEVREEERKRIAREIHDELGQTLTLLRMDLSTLESALGQESREVAELISTMKQTLGGTMDSVRKLIAELRPGLLDDLGLPAAVEWQCRDFQRRTGISCRITIIGLEERLEDEQATALFRILQEALTNVAKHARATAVNIRLERNGNEVVLTVGDNGSGMAEADSEKAGSFGLRGIRERVRQLGGSITLYSSRQPGATLVVRLPLQDGASPAL